jgi:hypothetical protein
MIDRLPNGMITVDGRPVSQAEMDVAIDETLRCAPKFMAAIGELGTLMARSLSDEEKEIAVTAMKKLLNAIEEELFGDVCLACRTVVQRRLFGGAVAAS